MSNIDDLYRKQKQAQDEYDKYLDAVNEARREFDNAYSADEKKKHKVKIDALMEKMNAASKKEKDIKRQIDDYMRNNR